MLLYRRLSMFNFVATAHAAEGISVKLSPYIVGYIGGLPITATLITTWLAMAILVLVAWRVRATLKTVPGKLQSIFEMLIGGAYEYMAETLENREIARRYFPVLMTIFLALLFMNLLGLFPGVTSIGYYPADGSGFIPFLYPPATDLNIAIGFAIIAMFVIQMAGILSLGVWKYGGKFINFSSPLQFLVGIIELISELGRLISFSFRLFGNIFAGKTLLTVAIFFVPVLLPVPILAFEVFVGFIQATVFAFLTLVFIKLAIAEPEH